MATKITIDWDGLYECQAKLSKAPMKARKLTNQVIKNNTEEMGRKASANAPKDTGFLARDSMEKEYSDLEGTVIFTADYAPYQEYGTRYIPAKRYLRMAHIDQTQQYMQDMKDVARGAFL